MRARASTTAAGVCAIAVAVGACSGRESVYMPGELREADFASGPGETTIVLVGDIMTWDSARPFLEANGVRHPFDATAAITRAADFAIGNLEGPIAVEAQQLQKSGYSYKVPPHTLEGLAWAGFDAVSLANNHVRDCGDRGIAETMQFLEAAGIDHFGAGLNLDEARRPKVFEVDGVRVALVAFLTPDTYLMEDAELHVPGLFDRRKRQIRAVLGAGRNRGGAVVSPTEAQVQQMVAEARAAADLVIVYPHWGIRYHRPVFADQRRLARAAIDAGADLVVGHHAHFWQPVEVYAGKPIVYGVGNFAFGSRNSRAVGGLLVRAVLRDGALSRVELYPTYTKNRHPQVNHQTKILRGRSAQRVLESLREWSAPLADVRIDDGVGIIDVPPAAPRAAAAPPIDAAPPPPSTLDEALAALRGRGLSGAADAIAARVAQPEDKFKLTAAQGRACALYLLAEESEALLALHEVMPRSTVELVRAIHERGVARADAEGIARFLVDYVAEKQFARLDNFDRNHAHVTGRAWREIDYSGEDMTWQGQKQYWSPRGVLDFKTPEHVRGYMTQAEKMPHFQRVYRPRSAAQAP